jgi:predicted transcriptional regulator
MMPNFILIPQKTKYLYTIATYIPSMTVTTIQVSKDLLEDLKSRKMYDKESYEDIIRDLLEDTMELSQQTLENIRKSEEDIKAGRVKTLAEVKARLKR